MIATISSSVLVGEVFAPASKSVMQRACALALLNKGTTIISNPGVSNDDRAALTIIQKCGAEVFHENGKLRIASEGKVRPEKVIHCGESGLSVRMFTPIVALGDSLTKLTGEGSLNSRPMDVFATVLPQLSVSVETTNGFLPMEIRGPVMPQECEMDGSKSSQYVTGILFALAKSAKKQLTLTVSNLTSRPYVDLSLEMLAHFGYSVKNNSYDSFVIDPFEDVQREIIYTIEGDWSGAAFLLVAATIAGKGVRIIGLGLHSMQADKAIVDVLDDCGVRLRMDAEGILIEEQKDLLSFEVDATHCPDLFPPLVALAAFCKGESIIHGTSRLISKESNRLDALIDVFSRMGVPIKAEGDTMIIQGGERVFGSDVDGHHDHRIVMACAVTALRAEGKMNISGAEAINKSYPDFFNHLSLLGAEVSLS